MRKILAHLRTECTDAWGTAKFELDPNMSSSRLTAKMTTQLGFFGRVSSVLVYECSSYAADPSRPILESANRMERATPELTLPRYKPLSPVGMSI